jgi:hypothetical protein
LLRADADPYQQPSITTGNDLMAKSKTATPTTRAPRGTKIVAEAFFTAVDQIPELQRADVVKAALALIRDRLKESRDKAKLAKEKQKAKGQRAPVPTKAVAPPKAAARKPVASANVKKPPAKATAKRGKAPPLKAPEPASTPSDETTMPNEA